MDFSYKAIASSIAIVFSALPSASQAAVTFFSNRVAFNAAAGPTSLETFNSFTTEENFRSAPLTVGAFSLNQIGISLGTTRNFIDIQPLQFSAFNVDGSTIVNGFIDSNSILRITFASAVTSFGADFASFGTGQGSSIVSAAGSSLVAQNVPGVQFIGFVSDAPFTIVELLGTFQTGGDGFGFDNLAFSSAIPEPATWAMMIFGFGLVGGALRRTNGQRRQLVRVTYA